MQSGISASKELVSQFNSLLTSESNFGLLVTIASESLQPVKLLPPVSPSASFSDNLSVLEPYIKPNEALYVLLRRHTTAPHLIAISYVPDAAPVRQKMLFASTRLTLVRELGSEHFRETIFTTMADELSAKGFKKHDAHSALAAPLTEEERSLGEVRRAEQEAGQGTGVKAIHLSKTMNMPITEDALDAIKNFGQGGKSLVMLKINVATEVVELVPDSSSPSSITELVQTISDTEPRFTFYRYEHTHGGSSYSPILFFYTCPVTPGNKAIKSRMMYPLMKRAVLEAAKREAEVDPEKKFEVEEPSEISEDTIIQELHPKVESRQAFSRPKRPGR